MRITTKKWLITAASLVWIGGIIFVGVMTMLRWDFTKLSTVKYETNTYEISETFHSISMKTDTADILFALSEDGKCKVECYEEEHAKHSVSVRDGTLSVEWIDERTLFDYIGNIGFHFASPRITVYLPEKEYTSLSVGEDTGDIVIPEDFHFGDADISLSTGDVDFRASASESIRIETSTGNIRVENISAASLELSVSTGRITAAGVSCGGELTVRVSTGKAFLSDIVCGNVVSSGNTGEISLTNVIAAEKISLKRSTGDVHLDGCDAAEIFVETDTGDVVGSLLSDKVFITETSTGRIDVPKTTVGGRCEVKTSTGDVRLHIQ